MSDTSPSSVPVAPRADGLFASLPAGLVYLDAAFVVRFVNHAACASFGISPKDTGRPFFEAAHVSRALLPAFRTVAVTGESFTFWGYPLHSLADGAGPSYGDLTIQRLDPVQLGLPPAAPGLLLFVVDVTRRVQAERGTQDALATARRSAEKLRATFEQMSDGVLVCDALGRTTASNEAARAILGEAISDVEQDAGEGRDATRLLSGEGRPVRPDETPWRRAAAGQALSDVELVVRRTRGASMTLSVNAAPLHDERGAVEGAVAVLRDVTEIHRTLAELRVANQRLEEDSRLKNEFVANMSHELRTPLNAILGFAQLLRLGPEGKNLSTRQVDGLERIHRNGRNLLSLIDGILDVARIEAGVRTLHPEHFDLVEAVQSAFGELESLAVQKAVDYRFKVEGEFPVVFTDRGRLRQVVVNLISNALKFTADGSVEVRLSRTEDSARIEVRDTGIGIKRESLGVIFDKFRQVDGSTTRRAGGVGLGLSIVRELVDLLGGVVDVQSTFGEGSVFGVTIPFVGPGYELEARPSEETSEDAETAPSGAGPLVLVIEDNPDSAVLLRTTLEQAGFRVRVADNGVAGLRLARALRPAAMTLDIMMPRMDGWRVLQTLRADPAIADTPVIVCSIVDNRLLGYRLGVSEYLTKPVEPSALLGALTNLGVSPLVGDVLVVDDERAMRDVVASALEGAGLSVRQASSGEEALGLIAEKRPLAVFIDLFMPGGMSGFEFLARMRSRPETAEVPVVLLTGRDVTPEERARLGGQISDVVRTGSMTLSELTHRLRESLSELGSTLRHGQHPDR